MKILSDRYKILFILFVALGIYYPSIFGEINSVDDQEMITALINTEKIDLKGLFLPLRPFDYYRPILWLSFLLDRFLFGCSSFFMHLNNILIHSANGILTFFISKEMIRLFKIKDKDYLPMFVSLLFILHPINTEAVNFISGRTDLFAGLFVFLSLFIFLRYGIRNYIGCIVAAIFYLAGLLTKEVAAGLFLFIAILVITINHDTKEKGIIKERIKLISPFLVVTIFYFFLRHIASGRSDAGIRKVALIAEKNYFFIHLGSAIKAFGFYIKKLFIPLPLNFGITEINRTFYFWFGLVLLFVWIYLVIKKRNLNTLCLIFSVLFFIPAILVAVSRIAWTPLAERYLYISSFGIALLTVLLIDKLNLKDNLTNIIIGILLILSGIVTVNRNIVWQSNLTLYEDTIKKSPNFAPARNEYGLALMNKGRYNEALEQFKLARKLAGKVKYNEIPTLNIIAIESLHKESEETKKAYLDLLEKSSNQKVTIEILKRLVRLTEDEIKKESNDSKREALFREEIGYIERLFELEKSGFYLYRVGQLYLALGQEEMAREHFKKAIELSPNKYYAASAKKILERWDKE